MNSWCRYIINPVVWTKLLGQALFCLLSNSIYFCTLAHIINFNLFNFVWNVNVLGKGQSTFTLQITKEVVTCVAGAFYRLLSGGRGVSKLRLLKKLFIATILEGSWFLLICFLKVSSHTQTKYARIAKASLHVIQQCIFVSWQITQILASN